VIIVGFRVVMDSSVGVQAMKKNASCSSCSPALGRRRSEHDWSFFAAMLRRDEIVARVVLDDRD
jgi:hypothetical protein